MTPTPPNPGMSGEDKPWDTETFKILEGILQHQGVAKPATKEFYADWLELETYIGDTVQEAIAKAQLEAINKFEWRMDCTTALSELYGWKDWVAQAKHETINYLGLAALTPTEASKENT